MTFARDFSPKMHEPDDWSLVNVGAVPDDATPVMPEVEGTNQAKLWTKEGKFSTEIYLQVNVPEICLEIWRKPSDTENLLSFFVTNYEGETGEAVIVTQGVYRLADEHGNIEAFGPTRVDIFLQP